MPDQQPVSSEQEKLIWESEEVYSDIDDIIGQISLNSFHYWLLLLCGLGFCVDAMEIVALSYINPCAGAEFNLTNREIASITSAVFTGQLIGATFWGPFADKFGRRTSYICSASIITLGVGGSTVPFDIFSEFLPHSVRGRTLMLTNLFWVVGELFVTFAAYTFLPIGGWRALVFATAVPVTCAVSLALWMLPESPRWLITNNRFNEAKDIVLKAAKYSATQPEPFTFDDDQTVTTFQSAKKGPDLRGTTVKIAMVWSVFGFAYYGVVLLITRIYESSADNEDTADNSNAVCDFDYGSIAFNTSAEFIGILATSLTIDSYLGRRGTQMTNYLLGAAALVAIGVIPSVTETSIKVLGFIMRAAAMGASCATWVMTPELYPTRVRATAHSMLNSIARIGAVASPFLVVSSVDIVSVAFILGLCNVLAAIAVFGLKETAGQAMDKVSTSPNCVGTVSEIENPLATTGDR
eukprot:GSChrysophyteH1.ASY1.ANO1.1182.1 assembled CDS